MASGFKTASVQSSQVPSTQTNFPAYVDLSRLGILTLAEAQSVRVYSDSSKTTELAREIVSASEMHVKVASIEDSTSIFVDWDGIRSDYGVATTYGRNAVWSDYDVVLHMDGDVVDSTGKQTPTNNGATFASGDIGQAANFNGSSDYIDLNHVPDINTDDYTLTLRAYIDDSVIPSAGNSVYISAVKGNSLTYSNYFVFLRNNSGTKNVAFSAYGGSGNYIYDTSYVNTDWNTLHFVTKHDSTPYAEGYVNGSSSGTAAQDGTQSMNYDLIIGALNNQGTINGYSSLPVSEFRLIQGAKDSNWTITEHNNQNDESSFWGTWTDASTITNNSAFFNFF